MHSHTRTCLCTPTHPLTHLTTHTSIQQKRHKCFLWHNRKTFCISEKPKGSVQTHTHTTQIYTKTPTHTHACTNRSTHTQTHLLHLLHRLHLFLIHAIVLLATQAAGRIYVYIYIFKHTYTYIYIYIYIQREFQGTLGFLELSRSSRDPLENICIYVYVWCRRLVNFFKSQLDIHSLMYYVTWMTRELDLEKSWQMKSRSHSCWESWSWIDVRKEAADTLQHTVTHCNALKHIATHCKTLQHTVTHCNAL